MKSSIRGIPFLYLPVIFLFSAGAGMAIYAWVHLLSSVFGTHQVSRVSIWMVVFFWLAVGSNFHGRWADKLKNPLVLAIILPAVTGLFLLAHPLTWKWLIRSFALINGSLHPGSFAMGFIRLLLCGTYLFIPLTSLGGLLPAISRFFTRSVIQAGSRWSALVTDATLGLTAGLVTAVLWIIPESGFAATLLAASGIILASALISAVFQVRTSHLIQSMSMPDLSFRPHKATMLFRKRRPVLEAGIKLSRAMTRVLMAHGFIVAAIIIAAGRLMNDYSTVPETYRMMVLIAVFLLAFALGSLLYRTYAPRIANGYLMLASLEILTGMAILFSLVLYPIAAPAMQREAAGATFGRTLINEGIAVASLVFLPAFLSGMILPLSARSFPRRLQHVGRSLGRLCSVFWFGIMAALVLVRFILFPLLGAYYTLLFLVMAALLSGIYILLRDSRLIRGFRLSYTALSLLLISGILTGMVKLGWIGKEVDTPVSRIIDKQEGSSALVRILKSSGNSKSLMINGITLTGNGGGDIQVQEIPPLLASVYTGNPSNALVLGFGTGIAASTLEKCQVPLIHITETNPEVITLASDVYSDDNNDILTSSRTGISIEDARVHLGRITVNYDLITTGYPALQILPGYYTTSFFKAASQRLTENGVLTQAISLSGLTREGFWSIIASCASVYPQVSLWYLDFDHVLLMAAKKRMPPLCRLMDQFFLELHPTLHEWDRMATLPGRLIMTDSLLRKLSAGYPVNSDDKPVPEFSQFPVNVRDLVLLGEIAGNMLTGKEITVDLGCPLLRESQIDALHESYREELMGGNHPAGQLP